MLEYFWKAALRKGELYKMSDSFRTKNGWTLDNDRNGCCVHFSGFLAGGVAYSVNLL